ncbi:MAG: GHKL domain-containing protein [Clostridia bacterium]|nr:GHKL domain-containing protein [Clostridia bacterium]
MNYAPEWYRIARSAIMLFHAVLGLMVFSYPLRQRRHFGFRLILGTLAGMFIIFLMRHVYIPGSTVPAMLSHALVSLTVYLLLIAIIWLCYDESIWTALFVAASGYIAQDIGGSVKTLFRQMEWMNLLSQDIIGILAVDCLCFGLVYLSLFLILRPFVKNRDNNFNNKTKAIFSVIVLLLCISMARLTQDNPVRNQQAIIAEALLQCIIDALMIALQFGVMERAQLNANVEIMRELVHQQRVQYEASKESAQIINEKYHDLKNLLRSFRGVVPQEQLDRLKQSIAAYERPANSGNEVLDVLLAEKIGICQQRNIVLTCSLGKTDFSFVEELDLYSLFQNALSNAINAVSALPESVERFITLSAFRDGNMLTIHMENPCQPGIQFVEGLPQTQNDPDWHGFGMRSMVHIAEKYSGTLTTEQQGNLFFLDILLLAP